MGVYKVQELQNFEMRAQWWSGGYSPQPAVHIRNTYAQKESITHQIQVFTEENLKTYVKMIQGLVKF